LVTSLHASKYGTNLAAPHIAQIKPGNIILGIDDIVTKDITQFVNYVEQTASAGDCAVLDVLTTD
jgi:hypothetical protein